MLLAISSDSRSDIAASLDPLSPLRPKWDNTPAHKCSNEFGIWTSDRHAFKANQALRKTQKCAQIKHCLIDIRKQTTFNHSTAGWSRSLSKACNETMALCVFKMLIIEWGAPKCPCPPQKEKEKQILPPPSPFSTGGCRVVPT